VECAKDSRALAAMPETLMLIPLLVFIFPINNSPTQFPSWLPSFVLRSVHFVALFLSCALFCSVDSDYLSYPISSYLLFTASRALNCLSRFLQPFSWRPILPVRQCSPHSWVLLGLDGVANVRHSRLPTLQQRGRLKFHAQECILNNKNPPSSNEMACF